jgi:hypothetical protein
LRTFSSGNSDLPVDNDCSGVVEIENGHDDLNLPKCDDIFDMLFDLQNIDSTENDFKQAELVAIGKDLAILGLISLCKSSRILGFPRFG